MARDWKARNTDRVKAYRAKHYKENKERARETHRSWMARHPGKKKVYQAAYTSKHKEKISLKRKNAEYKARRNKRARERYLHDYPYRIQLLRPVIPTTMQIEHRGRSPTSIARRIHEKSKWIAGFLNVLAIR